MAEEHEHQVEALIANPVTQSGWIHGTSLHLQDGSWSAHREGYWTTVRPSHTSTSGWIHFAIPTPTIINNRTTLSRAGWAMLRFTTGPDATITSIHVYDGETKIKAWDSLSLKGTLKFWREEITNHPAVTWGTGISVGVKFARPHDPAAWIRLIGSGIDFI